MCLCVLQDENRRFRVKFSPSSSAPSSMDACRQFTTMLAPLVPIREIGSSCGSISGGGGGGGGGGGSEGGAGGAGGSGGRIGGVGGRGVGEVEGEGNSSERESDSQMLYDTQPMTVDSQVVPALLPHCTVEGSGANGCHGNGRESTIATQPEDGSVLPIPDLAKVFAFHNYYNKYYIRQSRGGFRGGGGFGG